jgi:uncharacterized protein (DUF111 family)
MTTPTGAALAAAFVTHWQPFPALRPIACGYGAGSRTVVGASNTVRLLVGESISQPDDAGYTIENVTLVEANIDHRTPEAMAHAAENLLTAGALDVWQEPITMKKGRLGVRISLLCQPDRSLEFSQLMISLTGTLGVRVSTVERMVLPRESLTIETPYGSVRFKQGRYIEDERFITEAMSNDTVWLRPEHDDVALLSRKHGLDYQYLYDQLVLLVSEITSDSINCSSE